MIQGCMSSLCKATPIILTADERAELEGLARSTKTEQRTRLKAQIVLMAADGAPALHQGTFASASPKHQRP
jgi:hypothetical protein